MASKQIWKEMAWGNIPGQNKTLIRIFTEINLSIYRLHIFQHLLLKQLPVLFKFLILNTSENSLYINILQHNTEQTLKLQFTD